MKFFYCQSCGAEVSMDADTCPKCGKSFGSVLCPVCHFSGASRAFYNGCPKCGYLKVTKTKKLTFRIFLLLFILLITLIIFLVKLL